MPPTISKPLVGSIISSRPAYSWAMRAVFSARTRSRVSVPASAALSRMFSMWMSDRPAVMLANSSVPRSDAIGCVSRYHSMKVLRASRSGRGTSMA